jgi:hypothetical protein|tara:strand:- start:351 stop:959 length:609 start_codon:yes stop_codon:yes gene_type:complete
MPRKRNPNPDPKKDPHQLINKKPEEFLEKYEGEDKDNLERAQRYVLENLPARTKSSSGFPDEVKVFAKTLVIQGYTYQQVADICQVGRTTVNSWMNDPNIDLLGNTDLADKIKDRMASDLLIKSQMAFNQAMRPDKVEKASTLQLASTGGIMFDKARLLKGESTQNVAMAHGRINEYKGDIGEKEDDVMKLEAELALLEEED